MNFENHPLIPEQSEDHDKLVGDLVEWQNLLSDPRIASRIQEQKDGKDLLALLERTRIGALGEVTIVAYAEDPDYSKDAPPHHMSDQELDELTTRAATAFVTAESYPGN